MLVFDDARTLLARIAQTTPGTLSSVASPLTLIRAANTTACNTRLKETSTGIDYLDTINDIEWIDGASRQFLEKNAFLVMASVVYYDDVDELLDDITPYIKDADLSRKLQTVPEALYMNITEVIRITHSNVVAKPKLRSRFVSLCRELITWYAQQTITMIQRFETKRVIHVASYLSTTQQIWCLLLSYTHNATEIFTNLRNLFMPRRNIIVRCSDGQPVSFEIWRTLATSLPSKIKDTAVILDEFHVAIYAPESRHVSSVYGPKRIHHETISLVYPHSVLIRQIICMAMKNWAEIWFKSRWPRHPELIRRLLLYRKSTNGRLNYELVERMFFRKL